jgi:syntaxin 1B/2/3
LYCRNKQLDDAINSARRARRLKWACFIIVIVILIIIAIVLAIHFSGNNNK